MFPLRMISHRSQFVRNYSKRFCNISTFVLRSTYKTWKKPFSTSNVSSRDKVPSSYYRVSPDHRGNITPGNRPENEHSAVMEEDSLLLDESDYAALLHDSENFGASVVSKATIRGGMMVVLPWVKWGPQKKLITTADHLLDEAAALVSSLPEVTLLEKLVVNVRHMSPHAIFGPGQLDELKARLAGCPAASSLFLVVNKLTFAQVQTLERELGIRVIDRYWVVLAIFHQHARTIEARMQVALAELPYIRSRMKQPTDQGCVDHHLRRLQCALDKLQQQRRHTRHRRRLHDIPSIAVVGYTNAGKTSLISCLSGDSKVQGKEQLFATLDVTAHGFLLPCGSHSVLLDTVGFIQDLPTELVASFNATLMDACHADVIVHVRDVSHPDRVLHHTTVMAALYCIGLPSTTPIITVDNKADLIPEVFANARNLGCCSHLSQDDGYNKLCQRKAHTNSDSTATSFKLLQQLQDHYHSTPSLAVSAKTRQGLISMVEALEEQILQATHKRLFRLKLPTGGQHMKLLRSVAGSLDSSPCVDDPNKSEVVAALSERQLALFRKLCLSVNSFSQCPPAKEGV